MNLFLIFIFAVILVVPLWATVEGFSQSALEIIVDIKPGETQTVLWTLASDNENKVTFVEITARGNGSEFLSFPKSESIDPLQRIRVPILISIPADYPGGIELKPEIFAKQIDEDESQGNTTQADNSPLATIKFQITMKKIIQLNIAPNDNPSLLVNESEGGGCLIATATYGSELAPPVQMLREIRDNMVLQTQSGDAFMTGFNQLYYSFSPTIADWERENPAFKELVKLTITPLITSLSILNYVEIDSELEILGYGLGIMFLNFSVYLIFPIFIILRLKKKYRQFNI